MEKYDIPNITYDYIVVGTDLTEQILAYELSKKGNKVICIDNH